MGLSEPTASVIAPAVLPAVAVVDSVKPSLTRVTSGVFTDDALTVEAFRVVNVPPAAPPEPIVVLLMAPPPIATLLVWN